MLATVKVLQAKNASTGTMSMSKRLLAINDAFSAASAPAPAARLPAANGDVIKTVKNNNISDNKTNPCVAVLGQQKSLSFKDNPPGEVNLSNGCHAASAVAASQPPPVKPNSLILVPHQKSIHSMSNGGLIRPVECAAGAPRLIAKTSPSLASTKEVQTQHHGAMEVQTQQTSAVPHSTDCPLSAHNHHNYPPQPQTKPIIAKSKSCSDPLFSENSDDYLESASTGDQEPGGGGVPEHKGRHQFLLSVSVSVSPVFWHQR